VARCKLVNIQLALEFQTNWSRTHYIVLIGFCGLQGRVTAWLGLSLPAQPCLEGNWWAPQFKDRIVHWIVSDCTQCQNCKLGSKKSNMDTVLIEPTANLYHTAHPSWQQVCVLMLLQSSTTWRLALAQSSLGCCTPSGPSMEYMMIQPHNSRSLRQKSGADPKPLLSWKPSRAIWLAPVLQPASLECMTRSLCPVAAWCGYSHRGRHMSFLMLCLPLCVPCFQ